MSSADKGGCIAARRWLGAKTSGRRRTARRSSGFLFRSLTSSWNCSRPLSPPTAQPRSSRSEDVPRVVCRSVTDPQEYFSFFSLHNMIQSVFLLSPTKLTCGHVGPGARGRGEEGGAAAASGGRRAAAHAR
eukprot:386055-Rhodomonas_salina.1